MYDIYDGVCERNQTHARIDSYVMYDHKLFDYECYYLLYISDVCIGTSGKIYYYRWL